MAEILPDELWAMILDLGVGTTTLSYRDLCCLSISCRRLRRLSSHSSLWATLLSQDFPDSNQETESIAPSKFLYRTKFERDKARRLAAWRRRVLQAESHVAVCAKEIQELEMKIAAEGQRLKTALQELEQLQRARQASVALNVWQPEIVRVRQKQIVEQCTVPIDSRLSALKMEIKVCKQQITIFTKAYNKQKEKLSKCQDALKSLKYNPLQDYQPGSMGTTIKDGDVKKKKLKRP